MARAGSVQSSIPAPTREQIGAEFVEVDRQVKDFAPVAKRHEQLQKIIRGWYVDHPADKPAVFEGPDYRIHIGECGLKRYFTVKAKLKIFAQLGKAKAMELFSITLEAVETALGAPALDALVSQENVGSRKLVPVLKAVPVQQAEKAA